MSYILQENNLEVNNENFNLCSKCQGKCCKNMGCHYSPRDFKQIDVKTLKKLIDEGNTSIDWWEGDIFDKDDKGRDRTYYLRMRNKNSKIIDPSWGGECILLTEEGCSLSFYNRPMGGRGLIPNEKDCIDEYSKEDCCKEWYPYQNILEFLVGMYQ